MTKDIYQNIYEKHDYYGNAEIDRCPGVRLMPLYQHHLIPKVLDIGCGRGHTCKALNESGIAATGIDLVSLNNGMQVGDATQPLDMSDYSSVVCIDVIEHLTDVQVEGLFNNMLKVKRQAFSIFWGSDIVDGVQLHINQKRHSEWRKIIEAKFKIIEDVETTYNGKPQPRQRLYLTETK